MHATIDGWPRRRRVRKLRRPGPRPMTNADLTRAAEWQARALLQQSEKLLETLAAIVRVQEVIAAVQGQMGEVLDLYLAGADGADWWKGTPGPDDDA